MGRFIIVSFLVMGWAFYELSGGADFVPETRAFADAGTPEPEIVTRADTTTLVSLTDDTEAEAAPIATSLSLPLMQAETAAPQAEAVTDIAAIIAPIVAEPAPEVLADLRRVAGARVNMRSGPGTDFSVVMTLDQNTEVEVMSTEADWLRVVVTATGTEGWIAGRLLTAPN